MAEQKMTEQLTVLKELLKENMNDECKIQKLFNKSKNDAKLRQLLLCGLQEDYYRNKLLKKAIEEEETLIGIIKKFALFLKLTNRPNDKIIANRCLWFVKKATDLNARNYYRNLFNEFHSFCKKNYSTTVGEFSGRIKGFCSFYSKILETQYATDINDLFAFRFVLRANNHENEKELIYTLYKICRDFILFCEDKGLCIMKPSKLKDTSFSIENHPDITIPSKEYNNILQNLGVKNYVYNPKEDGYQSIHVCLESPYGPFEVQFRTQKMHVYAEEGPASHAGYKDKPLYNFFLNLASTTKQDRNFSNFIGLTAADEIYYRKLRHSDKLESSIPTTIDDLAFENNDQCQKFKKEVDDILANVF